MRYLIFIVVLALLAGCKSHKKIVSDKSLDIDSIARSEHHRTIAVIDSLVSNIDFSFDTLKINIERPVEYAEAPEVMRLTATKGRVIDRRRVYWDSVEAFNQLDTVAYKESAAEASTEHTATTRLYNPPDGTVVSIFAILGIACLIYLFFRKK
ncbi:MAG: hypothetical protein HDR95_05150 [Bacteroides sp.]|nr:hypothetical protein [Bacteroides sp.]